MRRSGTLVSVLLLSLALLFSGAGAAFAGDWNDPPPTTGGGGTGGTPTGDLPPIGTGEQGGSGGNSGQVGNCYAVASPSYLGLACGGSGGQGRTVKQILGNDKVPGCWWEDPLSPSELAAMNVQNQPGADGWTYYWKWCLHGVDPKTKKIDSPEGMTYTVSLKKLPNGESPKTLTANQHALVDGHTGNSQVPPPVAGVTPSSHPRVYQDVSFVDGTRSEVTAQAGSVVLRARIDGLDVEPLGADAGEKISCPGTGVIAHRGDTRDSRPHGCWFKYEKSSADQPDQQYQVKMTAHWHVEALIGGVVVDPDFADFTKFQITSVPVTEIQTLVVN